MNQLAQYTSGDLLGSSWGAMIDQQMIEEAEAQNLRDIASGVTALINRHGTSKNKIKSNSDYSESGRKSKLAELVFNSDEALDALTSKALADLKAKTQTLARAIANHANTAPTVSDVLLLIERRNAASKMDPLIVQTKLLELAANGLDDLSVHAILSAPALAPLVLPDVAERARAIMGARILPDQSKALDDARNSLVVMENIIGSAKNSFATFNDRSYLRLSKG
jgi:hypothetical protein